MGLLACMKYVASGFITEAQMRKQDRIQQEKNQHPSGQQGEQRSAPSGERVKGSASEAQPKPPRPPGQPLPIPE